MPLEAVPDPQTSIYEKVIEHDELAKLLVRRDTLAAEKSLATAKHREVDDAAKGLIATLDLGDGATVRVGDHLITRNLTKSADVSFTRNAGVRYGIKLFGGDES